MRYWNGLSGVAVCWAFWSCGGTTEIHENHILQANDIQGHVAYYKVSTNASAKLAKTSYRAGLYDAAAVDALFGNTSASDDDAVDQTLERRRRAAVDVQAKAYYDALSGEESVRNAAREALERALAPIPLRQKFVIIYSANASVVEGAIADFSEEKDTRNAVLSLIAPFKRDDFLREKADAEALERVLALVRKANTDLSAMKDPAGEPSEEYKDQLRRIVNNLAATPVEGDQ